MFIKFNLKFRRIAALILAMFGLATLSFNCAPSLFEAHKHESASSVVAHDVFGDQKTSPWVLQNTFQVFSSMASLTGQYMGVTAAQLQEYDIRAGALSQTDRLTEINAPLQLAATSLAGEFCNGLITKESAANAVRKYFTGVNFGTGLASNNATQFATSVDAMARSFWGRNASADELAILNAYYTDFVATAGTATAQTKSLYLSTCAAMLSSFDAITY